MAYGLIGVFMVAGLKQGSARARLYFTLPILALPTLVVVGLAVEAIVWALGKFAGLTFGGNPLRGDFKKRIFTYASAPGDRKK